MSTSPMLTSTATGAFTSAAASSTIAATLQASASILSSSKASSVSVNTGAAAGNILRSSPSPSPLGYLQSTPLQSSRFSFPNESKSAPHSRSVSETPTVSRILETSPRIFAHIASDEKTKASSAQNKSITVIEKTWGLNNIANASGNDIVVLPDNIEKKLTELNQLISAKEVNIYLCSAILPPILGSFPYVFPEIVGLLSGKLSIAGLVPVGALIGTGYTLITSGRACKPLGIDRARQFTELHAAYLKLGKEILDKYISAKDPSSMEEIVGLAQQIMNKRNEIKTAFYHSTKIPENLVVQLGHKFDKLKLVDLFILKNDELQLNSAVLPLIAAAYIIVYHHAIKEDKSVQVTIRGDEVTLFNTCLETVTREHFGEATKYEHISALHPVRDHISGLISSKQLNTVLHAREETVNHSLEVANEKHTKEFEDFKKKTAQQLKNANESIQTTLTAYCDEYLKRAVEDLQQLYQTKIALLESHLKNANDLLTKAAQQNRSVAATVPKLDNLATNQFAAQAKDRDERESFATTIMSHSTSLTSLTKDVSLLFDYTNRLNHKITEVEAGASKANKDALIAVTQARDLDMKIINDNLYRVADKLNSLQGTANQTTHKFNDLKGSVENFVSQQTIFNHGADSAIEKLRDDVLEFGLRQRIVPSTPKTVTTSTATNGKTSPWKLGGSRPRLHEIDRTTTK